MNYFLIAQMYVVVVVVVVYYRNGNPVTSKKLNLNLEHSNNADFREGDRTRVDVRIRIHSRMTYKF